MSSGDDVDSCSSSMSDASELDMPMVAKASSEKEFTDRCEHIRRNTAIRIYREFHLEQGRTRRSVSGSSGRILHELDAYAAVRARVGQELPPQLCRQLDALVNFLDRMWSTPHAPNDQEFVRRLGNAEDPNKASVLQRFQVLFHTAATQRRIPVEQARTMEEIISKEVQHTLYRAVVEFMVRSLPGEYRRQLLEWISECKLRYRSRPSGT